MNHSLFLFSITILSLSAAKGSAIRQDRATEQWEDFKASFGKSYSSEAEEQQRFEIWQENSRRVEQHNAEYEAGQTTFTMAINSFGDMTNEEFSATMKGFTPNGKTKSRGVQYLPPHNVKLPDKVDWRTNGYVTAVKDQNPCGSCWAFSAVGALEGQHFRKTKTLVSLSEQDLVDCVYPDIKTCDIGGYMNDAFEFIRTHGGIDTEASYPYEGIQRNCRFNNKTVGATDIGYVNITTGDEQQLQNAVATVGPVSVGISATFVFQFYGGGILKDPVCGSAINMINHAVLVVGYDTSPEGVAYWIVKNSWGTAWGESGYIRMPRNQQNHCGIATLASYPLM